MFNKNELYIAVYNDDKISKVDVTSATPTVTDVVTTGISGPSGIAIFMENQLYFAQYRVGKVSKISLTEAKPTVVDVITGAPNPLSLLIENNILYFSETSNGTVSKSDLAPY